MEYKVEITISGCKTYTLTMTMEEILDTALTFDKPGMFKNRHWSLFARNDDLGFEAAHNGWISPIVEMSL